MYGVHRVAALAAFIFVLFLTVTSAPAQTVTQDPRQNQPGQFDFYVLSLSWSPSYCEASQERYPNRKPNEQCAERHFSFVVHGLWPQYEKGFPEYCQQRAPKLDRALVSSMLDLMPSPRLIFNEWSKHGTCAGFAARGYFEQIRKARAVVKIPEAYLAPETAREVTPAEVEDAFIQANPGLSAAAISMTCDSKRLNEVRICLSKDLQFRDCAELERRSCKRPKVVMPAVRAGGLATAQ